MNNCPDIVSASAVDSLVQKVLLRVKKKISRGEVIVQYAGPLSQDEKDRLTLKIRQKFPQAANILFQPDESLIAGIRISYGDYLYEDSVQGRLQQLRYVIKE